MPEWSGGEKAPRDLSSEGSDPAETERQRHRWFAGSGAACA
jgi:hypothetical protein